MKNQVVWLDMPVLDLDRAINFYSHLLAGTVHKEKYEQFDFAVLPHEGEGNGGCLIPSKPEDIIKRGPLIYFNVNGYLDNAIKSVVDYGGEIIENKHSIGPHGFRAIILDSEGNRIAIHSESE